MAMKLTEPGSIGRMVLKNRMVMAPMGAALDDYGPQSAAYYLARARGGAALLLINTQVSQAVESLGPSEILSKQNYQQLAAIIAAAHQYDCKIGIQLHPGNGRIAAPPPGRTRPLAAACVLAPDGKTLCEPLSRQDIHLIEEGFKRGLYYAGQAGADCIEIHAYGGYLADQFLTKRWNNRTDEYGGSLSGRMRFLNELIALHQQELGSDFPLLVKFTPEHGLPPEEGYRALAEGVEIAIRLEQQGVTALHIDVGCHDNWYLAMPPIYQQQPVIQLKIARAVKAAVNIPVITNGRLGDVGKAEAALAHRDLDFVVIGRGLLADSDLPNKVLFHQQDTIRPCISCNEGCIAHICAGRSISCAVNPRTGQEWTPLPEAAKVSKRILVVGAGPAGCQAALMAADRGHQVEIWEKAERLGGKVIAASAPIFKQDLARLLSYYERQLLLRKIPLLYGQTADLESVLSAQPEAVIWAAGAQPLCPAQVKGIESAQVVFAEDLLRNHRPLGECIAVIGGGLVGCETALHLDTLGKRVILIEMQPELLADNIFLQNKMMLINMLKASKIMVLTGRQLTQIKAQSIVLTSEDGPEEMVCDQVVLALGYQAQPALYAEIAQHIPVFAVGDAYQPGKIGDAIHTGYQAACRI